MRGVTEPRDLDQQVSFMLSFAYSTHTYQVANSEGESFISQTVALFRVKEVTINIYTGTMGKPGYMVILVTSANEKQSNDTVITIIANREFFFLIYQALC